MTITTLNPHDTEARTSIAHAFEQGYQITPDGDGCAQILTPAGAIYHVNEWECDCPDAFGRQGGSYELPDGRRCCKHVLFISQLYPCAKCGASMVLNTQAGWKAFVCTCCGAMKAACAVRTERRTHYRQREQVGDEIRTTTVSKPLMGDEPARRPFRSVFGIDYNKEGDRWVVRVVGFMDSAYPTEGEALERAERLAALEAAYHDRRRRSNVA